MYDDDTRTMTTRTYHDTTYDDTAETVSNSLAKKYESFFTSCPEDKPGIT